MGIVEELGSGMRKMFKYTPLYANGKEPIIEEQDGSTGFSCEFIRLAPSYSCESMLFRPLSENK